MNVIDRRRLILGVGATALAGCSQPLGPVTEADKRPPEGGIGGTGIVGTLTGFGSLLINGLRVETRGATVTDAYGATALDALEAGQALTVEAATVDGALRAARIHVADPLIGAVDAVSSDRRRIRVNGVIVTLLPGLSAALLPGDRVAVSGLWRAGGIVASRIAPVDMHNVVGQDVLAGAFRRGSEGHHSIEGAALRLQVGIAVPEDGSFVTARGRHLAEAGLFLVERLVPGRFLGAAGPLQRLSVEGYLDPVETAPGYTLAGLGHSFDAAARLSALATRRALYTGPYSGLFDVAEAVPLPEAVTARRALLDRLRLDPAGVERLSTR
ncbi:MAG: DUF5666 domain-containing protein [Pseudomonadota bacterium]